MDFQDSLSHPDANNNLDITYRHQPLPASVEMVATRTVDPPVASCSPKKFRENDAIPGGGERLHLPFLDGIRGVAALYVVLHHFLSWSAIGVSHRLQMAISWTAFGHLGVVLFIVLSGFSLMLPVALSADKSLKGGTYKYIVRRARRILPPYFAALLLSIGIIVGIAIRKAPSHVPNLSRMDDLSLGSLVSHALLVQNINSGWATSINMAFWSIATEWQIYLFFPVLLLPIWRRWNVACVAVGFAVGMFPILIFSGPWNLEQGCPWFLGLFAMGMCSASYFVGSRRTGAKTVWIACGMALSLAAYILCKFRFTGDRFAPLRDVFAGAICCGLILILGIRGSRTGGILMMRMFESDLCVLLGSFSYSLYLTHCAVLNIFGEVARESSLGPDAALGLRAFVGIPMALAVAYVFYLFFERPFIARRLQVAVN
jgi:peptidoglycan/LPS O-acetylase OafA/YrhL